MQFLVQFPVQFPVQLSAYIFRSLAPAQVLHKAGSDVVRSREPRFLVRVLREL